MQVPDLLDEAVRVEFEKLLKQCPLHGITEFLYKDFNKDVILRAMNRPFPDGRVHESHDVNKLVPLLKREINSHWSGNSLEYLPSQSKYGKGGEFGISFRDNTHEMHVSAGIYAYNYPLYKESPIPGCEYPIKITFKALSRCTCF